MAGKLDTIVNSIQTAALTAFVGLFSKGGVSELLSKEDAEALLQEATQDAVDTEKKLTAGKITFQDSLQQMQVWWLARTLFDRALYASEADSVLERRLAFLHEQQYFSENGSLLDTHVRQVGSRNYI